MEEHINAYINEYVNSEYRRSFPSNQKQEWIPIELWKYIIFLSIPEEEIGENVFEKIEKILVNNFVDRHPDDIEQVCISSYWPVDYQVEVKIIYTNILYAYMNVVEEVDKVHLLQSMILYPVLGKMVKIKYSRYKEVRTVIRTFFRKYFSRDLDEVDLSAMDLSKVRSELIRKYKLHQTPWMILSVVREITNYFKLGEAKEKGKL